MAGTITSLGIGSNILTSDLITKIRSAEESSRITPIDTSIKTIQTKQAALSSLLTNLVSVKSNVSDLADSMTYLKRTATSTSTDVGITVDSGVKAQSLSVKVTQLAQNDVYQSVSGYSSEDSTITGTSSTMSIKFNGTTSTVTINSGETLSSLASKINTAGNGSYSASVLNTGIGSDPYKLIIKSKTAGTDNALVINDSLGLFSNKSTGANAITSGLVQASYTGSSVGTDTRVVTSEASYVAINAGADTRTLNQASYLGANIATTTRTQVQATYLGTNAAQDGNQIHDGEITINGTDILRSDGTVSDLIQKINDQSSTTNVTASLDSSGKIKLTASNGSDIALSVQSTDAMDVSGLTSSIQATESTVASPTYSGTLSTGDITINGQDISASDGTIADLIQKINEKTADTDVTASLDSSGKIKLTSSNGTSIDLSVKTATAVTLSGLTSSIQATESTVASPTYTGTLSDGDITINGTSILASDGTVADLVQKINDQTSTTNVTASVNGDGKIELASSNGASIALAVKTADAVSLSGLTSTIQSTESTVATPTYGAGASLGAGDIMINGTSIDASSGTVTDLLAKINAKSGTTNVTAALDSQGKMKLTSTDGKVISLAVKTGDAVLVSGLTSSIQATSTTVASPTSSSLASGDLIINGEAITFTYSSASGSASYNEQLKAAINAKTSDTGVEASLTSAGKLVLTSKTNDDIVVTTTANGATLTGLTSGAVTDSTLSESSRLQAAQNSLFTYNGVSMSRSTNSVDDIVVGMKLTFNKVMDTAATLDITQDTSSIVKSFKDFVTNYNTLSTEITNVTKFDTDTKKAATFTGQNEITSIMSKLNKFLSGQNEDGLSLTDVGLTRNENGTITLDESVLTKKLKNTPEAVEKLLMGTTDYVEASYKGISSVTAGTPTLNPSDLIINGVYIKYLTLAGPTAVDNATQLADHINTYKSETGVTATIDSTGKLTLTDPKGGEINITTTANGASLTGLTSGAVKDQRMAIGKSTQVNGFFADMLDTMKALMVGSTSSLKLFETALQKEYTTEVKNKKSVTSQIDIKYELMASQFAEYDSMINKYNQMGTQITAAINALNNG